MKKEFIFWKSPDLQLEPQLAPAKLPVCSPVPGQQRALSCIPGSKLVPGFLQPSTHDQFLPEDNAEPCSI